MNIWWNHMFTSETFSLPKNEQVSRMLAVLVSLPSRVTVEEDLKIIYHVLPLPVPPPS